MKVRQRIMQYILKSKGSFLVLLVIGLFFVLFSVSIPYFLGLAIDEIANYIGYSLEPDIYLTSGDYNLLILYIVIIAILIVFSTILNYFFDSLTEITIANIVRNMKNDIFIKLNKVPISYIDSTPHGDLVSRCLNDCDYINTALVGSFKQFYEGIITIIITFIFMFFINWILGFLVVILTPISFLISYLVAKNSNKYYKDQVKMEGELASITNESILNIETIKSFSGEEIYNEKFSTVNKKLYKVGQKAIFLSSFTNPSTRLINNTTYAIVGMCASLLCSYAYIKTGTFEILGTSCTVGVISTFLQYANQFAKPFNEMSSVLSSIQQGYQSFKRVNEVLNAEDDIDLGKNLLKNPIKNINFDKIYFSYNSKSKLIQDFNLNINQGMKVALVGPTGCGKTTMINLLMRFYDSQSGTILVNEIDSKEIKKNSFRSHFGLVLQDTWIFNGTVFQNVSYSKPNATFEEVKEACKKANCLSFIERLPNGFDTYISQDSGLSQGQKQLLTIARLFLLDPDVIILDEATSNIDTISETKIVKAFESLMQNKISFIIAHRLSTIQNSDLIVVINDGHIVECGNHKKLLENKGFYYNLFNAQFDN